MITTGAKFWFGVAGLALVAGIAYTVFSDGEGQGTLVLLSLLIAALVLGVLTVVLRDGEVRAPLDADVVDPAEAAGIVSRPQPPALWPALGALGVGVTALGAATGGALVYVGIGLLVVTAVEWMVQGWSERATGDQAYNTALRNRIMFPLEIPVLGLVGAAVVLGAFSRVLLALPQAGSTVIAITVATLILGAGALVATRPRISSSLVAVVGVVGAVGLLGGGVVGAVAGEREIEEHGEEGDEGQPEVEADVTIRITQEGFEPAEATITVGEPVRILFENDDEPGRDHSLQIQGIEGAATGAVGSGEQALLEFTAEEADTYEYIDGVAPDDTAEGRLVAQEGAERGEDLEVPEAEPGAEDTGADVDESPPDTQDQQENSDGGEQDADDQTDVSTAS